MSVRPIIFFAPMIRALLDGQKTQTRRVLKPQPQPFDALFSDAGRWWTGDAETGAIHEALRVPYTPGDLLWCREAISGQQYAADFRPVPHDGRDQLAWLKGKKRDHASSIHMPRWASRLTLRVTDVRVQRVQDISPYDIHYEGVRASGTRLSDVAAQLNEFIDIWNSIHGPDAWDANPWVCALTFDVIRANVDDVP